MVCEKLCAHLFLPQRSQYGVLDAFTHSLAAALREWDVEVVLFAADALSDAMCTPSPDFTFAFNGVPIIPGEGRVCDVTSVPHLTWLVDLPYHYLPALDSPLVFAACDDLASCRFLKQRGFVRSFFLPQAASFPAQCPPASGRGGGAFFASFLDFEAEVGRWRSLPSHLERLARDVAEAALNAPEHSLLDLFIAACEDSAQELLAAPPHFSALASSIELYVKGRARAELVLALDTLSLSLFDPHWEPFLSRHASSGRWVYHSPLSYQEMKRVLPGFQFVCSNTIRSPYGGSERLLDAMAAGAVAVTDKTPFVQQHFLEDEELVCYTYNDLDLLPERLEMLLEDPKETERIAAQAFSHASKEHSWTVRARQLLDAFLPLLSGSVDSSEA